MFGLTKKNADSAAVAYDRGDLSRALKLARKGLRKNPRDTGLMLIAGNVFYVRQDYRQADFWYQKILELQPLHPQAGVNHGEVLLLLGDYQGAAAAAAVLEDKAAAVLLQAKIDFEQENYPRAEAGLSEFLKHDPQHFWGWNLLSQTAQKNAHWELALMSAWQAVKKSGGADSQHLNMAYALYEIALETGVETVLPVLKKWCAEYAGNGIVEQTRNAFFPNEDFCKSDEFYIRCVFDNFADSFEQTLQALDYHAPELIAAEIERRRDIFSSSVVRILDAGCGTGLCAPHLDSLFKKYRLFGVDLSARMLAAAAAKKLYCRLENEELETYLRRHKNAFDLIVAADVVTYFGALESLLFGCFEGLSSGGLLVFTVTANIFNDKPWFQHLSGRFVHAEKYVRHTLSASGFSGLGFTAAALRREGEKEVRGWIVSAVKK